MSSGLLVDIWLNVLAIFEMITIARCSVEPIHKAFPLFRESQEAEGMFKPLFLLLALFLVCVRINLAFDIRSKDAVATVSSARVNAMIHVAEAVYYTGAAFGQYGVFSTSFGGINLQRHGMAIFVYGTIIFNALFFTVFYLQCRQEQGIVFMPGSSSGGGGGGGDDEDENNVAPSAAAGQQQRKPTSAEAKNQKKLS